MIKIATKFIPRTQTEIPLYAVEMSRIDVDKVRTIQLKGGKTTTIPLCQVVYKTYNMISKKELIIRLIRLKYDIDDEFAINRQRDSNIEEFEEYYNYVEECKRLAQEYIDERLNKKGND